MSFGELYLGDSIYFFNPRHVDVERWQANIFPLLQNVPKFKISLPYLDTRWKMHSKWVETASICAVGMVLEIDFQARQVLSKYIFNFLALKILVA